MPLERCILGLLCFNIGNRLEKQNALQESTAHAQQVGTPRDASALICLALRVDHAVAPLPHHKLARALFSHCCLTDTYAPLQLHSLNQLVRQLEAQLAESNAANAAMQQQHNEGMQQQLQQQQHHHAQEIRSLQQKLEHAATAAASLSMEVAESRAQAAEMDAKVS